MKKKILIGVIILLLVLLSINMIVAQLVENKNDKKPTEETKELKGVTVTYTDEVYNKESKDGNLVIYNVRNTPNSISIDEGEKVLEYLLNVSNKDWSELIDVCDEMIGDYEDGLGNVPPRHHDQKIEIGVKYTFNHYVHGESITFDLLTSGSLGGANWDDKKYYNFDIKSGEPLELKDICKKEEECKKFLKNYYLKELNKSEIFPELYPEYEATIEGFIFKVGYFGFTENGFVISVPEYELASGTSGNIEFIVPYKEFNKYLNSQYKE